MDKWITKLDLYPDTFTDALEKMVTTDEKIITDSQLCSAMSTYGKYSAAAALQKRGRKSKQLAVKRLQLKGTGMIPVQPTATARRKASVHMGRGGRRLHAGRPPKASYTHEHGYCQPPTSSQMPSKVFSLPGRKRIPTGHNLSHCVTQNKSLGKTHSTK